MTKPYFLIDFENVQPKALNRLQPGTSRIKVFLGQHQSKLMLELVQALQPFGADAEYIQIQGSGPDAVDFHIAFYIGRVAAHEPDATFNIISKDKGFDPLVRHLIGLGIQCHRLAEIPDAVHLAATTPTVSVAKKVGKSPAKKAAARKTPAKGVTVTVEAKKKAATGAGAKATTAHARVLEVVALLKRSNKPAKVSTLKSSIKSWLKPAVDDKTVDAIVQSLKDSKKITVTGTKVAYDPVIGA